MVKQNRQIFDLKDILQIRIACGLQYNGKKCDGEILYHLGPRAGERNWRCPRCAESWKTDFDKHMPLEMRQVSPQESASMELLKALETLSGPNLASFTIRFEIDGEEKDNG